MYRLDSLILSGISPAPSPIPRVFLTVALLCCLLVSGCERADPLVEIQEQQAAGQFKESIEPLRKLLAKNPDDPQLNYLYGRAMATTHGSNLSMWSLRKAMKDPEWLVPAGSQLAFMALSSGDFNEVVEIATRILEQEPENVKILMMRANAYAHWKKDPELALADANRALELEPDVLEAYEPLILALLDLGRMEEAREALAIAGRKATEAGAAEGVLAWHCATTAVFAQEVDDLEQAQKDWRRCVDTHPTNLDVVTSAMAFYDSQGEYERSLEIARAAALAAPANRRFRVMFAERLRVMGKIAEAESILREATQTDDPEAAAAAWMDMSKLRQTQGEYGASADALEQAIELAREAGPPNPQLLFEHADALILAGRYDRALEAAANLQVPAHRSLIRARVAQERRNPAIALKGFDEALVLWPDNPWARYYAALAAEELGDFGRALSEYRYSIRIDPFATDARSRGAALLLAEGKASFAFRLLMTAGSGGSPPEVEGQLLFMLLAGMLRDSTAVLGQLTRTEATNPAWSGLALAEAAEGVLRASGPDVALGMLASAPQVDYGQPRFAPALRKLLELSYQVGKSAATRETLQAILAEHPDSSPFVEIHGFDLELSGSPVGEVREVYSRAVELWAGNAHALSGLGRLALADDPETALTYFDRAAAANPSDPEPKSQAARALLAMGRLDEAAQRFDALLLAHPFDVEAATARAELDLERGTVTDRTLERARRAVRFGGGPDALELLSRVHVERGEAMLAAHTAKRAQALREGAASGDDSAPTSSDRESQSPPDAEPGAPGRG